MLNPYIKVFISLLPSVLIFFVFGKCCQKKFENLRKWCSKEKEKIKASKTTGISTKESQEIAGDQSSITFMLWLDPFIVSRLSKNNFIIFTADLQDQVYELSMIILMNPIMTILPLHLSKNLYGDLLKMLQWKKTILLKLQKNNARA